MAPLAGAAKAAVEDFFAGRRGARVLHPDVQAAIAAYFVAKGLTVPEIHTQSVTGSVAILQSKSVS